MKKCNPFRYFRTSPAIIRLAVLTYVRFPLSLRNVWDLLDERGIDISHETARFWWNRFGPMFAAEIRKMRAQQFRACSNWLWYLDEVFVKISCETNYLWRAVDHEGEVLESIVTKRQDRKAALKFRKKSMRRHGKLQIIGNAGRQETGHRMNGFVTLTQKTQLGRHDPRLPSVQIRLDLPAEQSGTVGTDALFEGALYSPPGAPGSCQYRGRVGFG